MLDTRGRYNELQKYSKYLKSELKNHQGTKIDKDGKIYKKFKIYQNLKKLMEKWKINNHDENVILKVNSYYELLNGKIIKMKKSLEKEKNKLETQTVEDIIEERPEEIQQENEPEVDEIGPTPQLNGRVLGLFDIQTSPIKSPTKSLKLGNNISSLEGCKLNLGILLDDNNSKTDDVIFKTPTTKRVVDLKINETPGYLHSITQRMSSVDEVLGLNEWSDISEGDVSEDDDDYEEGEGKKIGIELRKKKYTQELNYNWDDDVDEEGIEPSPLIKRCSRSLFDMHNELGSLKKILKDLMQEEMIDIKYAENDEHVEITEEVERRETNVNRPENGSEINKDEVNENESENENHADDGDGDKNKEINHENKTEKENKYDEEVEQQFNKEENEFDTEKLKKVHDPHAYLRNKAKTIKRSTRRSRLKTTKIGPIHDEYEDVNLHDIIKKSKNEDDNTDEDDYDTKNNEYEEEYGGDIAEEEVYVRKDFSDLLSKQGKGKGKHPLSNNFVRLKINNKRKRRR